MADFEKEKRNLLGKIYELEKETSKLVREKSKFDRDRIGIDQDIKKVSRRIVELEDEIKKTTKEVMKRWVQIQKMNDLPWMYILLSSYSPSELERMLKSFESINKNEAEVIKEYIAKVEELDKEKIKLRSFAKNLIIANKGIFVKEKNIKNQNLQRKNLLAKLNKKIRTTEKNINSAKKIGKRLAGIHDMEDLKLLFGSSFFEKKGLLPHPVDSAVKHEYGLNKILLKDNVKLLHKGYFYQAESGDSVKSIGVGRIRYSKKKKGLGYTVIIDHGSNYYSLYTHLRSTKVKKDDLVETSTVIGRSGRFNVQFGSGIYFEIRHFSEPENPKKWLKKRIKKDKLAKI